MKERPIIFIAESVRAILDGSKTQTRRTWGLNKINKYPDSWEWIGHDQVGRWSFRNKYSLDVINLKCPYGQAGDRLWMKETWATTPLYDCIKPSNLKEYDDVKLFYKTDVEGEGWFQWRPSLFMPRWASRIDREITKIRAERVQDITEADAIAEGVGAGFQMNAGWPDYQHIRKGICELTQDTATASFTTLWDSINAKRGYGWDKNNWVWPISFKKID